MSRIALFGSLLASLLAAGKEAAPTDTCHPVPANLPVTLAVQSGEALALELYATGTQNYACGVNDAGVAAWRPAVPVAQLHRCDASGALVGTHSAGPTWTWTADSSSFVGDKTALVGAPSPEDPRQDIPWLLLPRKGIPETGTLGRMKYVQRVKTAGGVILPGAGCNLRAADAGLTVAVPYHATYLFYR